jgi:ABC-type glycerol-3-phosphate transport system substrate-binding protein
MNSPENVERWTWLQQFYLEGLSPTPGTGMEETLGFTTGRSNATMAGQWYTRNIVQDDAPSKFDIGMVPFPVGPAGQFSVAALNSYYFGNEPANPTEAWSWYKERSFSETAGEIYAPIGGGRFPPRKSIAPAVLYDWEDTEVYEAIRPNLRTYRTSPKESEWTTMWEAAWDEMVLGTRPVSEILDQLAEESTSLVS